jgi:hypothetical protein
MVCRYDRILLKSTFVASRAAVASATFPETRKWFVLRSPFWPPPGGTLLPGDSSVQLSTSGIEGSVVPPGSTFSLFASVSGAAWNATEPVSYRWECAVASNSGDADGAANPCGVELGSGAFNLISVDSLVPGTYSFQVRHC